MEKIKKILLSKISFDYCKYSNLFEVWLHKKWNGKLIYLHISKLLLTIDIRDNFVKEMVLLNHGSKNKSRA